MSKILYTQIFYVYGISLCYVLYLHSAEPPVSVIGPTIFEAD